MQNKLQSSLLSSNQYLRMGWVEFTKNFKIFLCLSLLVTLSTMVLDFFSLDLSIIENIVPGFLILLTTAHIIERSIRSQTVNINIALKNIVLKYLMAWVACFIVSCIFSGILLLPIILFSFSLIFDSNLILIIGILGVAILSIVSVIFFLIILSFTYYAIALRNCRFNALNYSWSLIKNRFWTVFWRYIKTYTLLGLETFIPATILTVLFTHITASYIMARGLLGYTTIPVSKEEVIPLVLILNYNSAIASQF